MSLRATTRPMGVRRGILGGAVLVAVGAPFLLQALGVANSSAYLFVALGVAFLAAWYVGTRQYVYIPGRGAHRLRARAGTSDLAAAAGGRCARDLPRLAIADVIGLHLPQEMQPFFVPVVLIAVGVSMLVER